jgi:hypothetical protein
MLNAAANMGGQKSAPSSNGEPECGQCAAQKTSAAVSA